MSEPPPQPHRHFHLDFFQVKFLVLFFAVFGTAVLLMRREQVLEEARSHSHCSEAAPAAWERDHSASVGRFKLQKPTWKDQERKKSRNRKPRWSWSSWRSALDLIFKIKSPVHVQDTRQGRPDNLEHSSSKAMAMQSRHSVSGPLYLTESRNVPRTRHGGYSRSGPLLARVSYVCLSTNFTSTAAPPPLYLVT